MSREQRGDAFRQAFQDLAGTPGPGCSGEDLARIWSAVRGELEADERHAIVERLAADPALAEAWRVAHALAAELSPETDVRQVAAGDSEPRLRSWRLPLRLASWRPSPRLAIAAVLVLGVSIAVLTSRNDSGPAVFRDAGGWTAQSLLAPDAALPRSAFRLRWTAAPEGARYQVRVTTEDLRLLATVADLTTVEVTIDAGQLAALPSGARVLWQVETTFPDGERTRSSTFVTRIE
jgi:hypothetical protein